LSAFQITGIILIDLVISDSWY